MICCLAPGACSGKSATAKMQHGSESRCQPAGDRPRWAALGVVDIMRVLTAAFLVLAATHGAGASSIIIVGDANATSSGALSIVGDTQTLANSPSVISIGTPAKTGSLIEPVDPAPNANDEPIPAQPVVIRAGVEGAPYERSGETAGSGAVQTATSDQAKTKPAPIHPVTPAPAIDPTSTSATKSKDRDEAQPLKPTARIE